MGTAKTTIVNQAWQGAASYAGVKPRKPFDPKNGTWGALELTGRYQGLYLDPDNVSRGITTASAATQRATDYGFGFNWYLNN